MVSRRSPLMAVPRDPVCGLRAETIALFASANPINRGDGLLHTGRRAAWKSSPETSAADWLTGRAAHKTPSRNPSSHGIAFRRSDDRFLSTRYSRDFRPHLAFKRRQLRAVTARSQPRAVGGCNGATYVAELPHASTRMRELRDSGHRVGARQKGGGLPAERETAE